MLGHQQRTDSPKPARKFISIASPAKLEPLTLDDITMEEYQEPTPEQREIANLKQQLALQIAEHDAQVARLQTEINDWRSMLSAVFSPAQIRLLSKATAKVRWSPEDLSRALQLRYKLGVKSYNLLRSSFHIPLPSRQAICWHLRGFAFDCGILSDWIGVIKKMAESLGDRDLLAFLNFDEMEIQQAIRMDAGLKRIVGMCSLPSCDEVGTHILVAQLHGLTAKWHSTVAWHVTGRCTNGNTLYVFLLSLLTELANAGFRVVAIGSDMGGCNQQLWRLLGISVNRDERIYSFRFRGEMVCVVPDPPHLLKNLRNCLLNGAIIRLPDSMCLDKSLPSAWVSWRDVQALYDLEKRSDLRAACKLTERHVKTSGRDKMKVWLAKDVFSDRTATAMMLAVESGILPAAASATAFFIRHVARWYETVTATRRVTAFCAADGQHLSAMQETIWLFTHIQIWRNGKRKRMFSFRMRFTEY
jgi:hypothetical protein